MKKGDYVARIIEGFGTRTATITKVSRVSKGQVHVEDSDHLTWEKELPHNEIDPSIAGFNSYLVPLEHDDEPLDAFWEAVK